MAFSPAQAGLLSAATAALSVGTVMVADNAAYHLEQETLWLLRKHRAVSEGAAVAASAAAVDAGAAIEGTVDLQVAAAQMAVSDSIPVPTDATAAIAVATAPRRIQPLEAGAAASSASLSSASVRSGTSAARSASGASHTPTGQSRGALGRPSVIDLFWSAPRSPHEKVHFLRSSWNNGAVRAEPVAASLSRSSSASGALVGTTIR
jgi:hypothetical protein